MTPQISIILPCYNEGKKIYTNLVFLHNFLHSHFSGHNIDFICVNDGSEDNTFTYIKKFQNKFSQHKIVNYSKNRGKGYAIKKGLEKAQGDIIALYDSDLDIEPICLIEHIQFLLKNKKSKIVIGTKKAKGCQVRRSIKRKILSEVNIQINNILFNLPVTDTQTGLKVFRKELKSIFLDNVQTHGYAFDIDFLYHVTQANIPIESLPVHLTISSIHTGVNNRAIIRCMREIIILYRKLEYKIEKKNIKFKTRLRLITAKCIAFPIQKFLSFFDQKSRIEFAKNIK